MKLLLLPIALCCLLQTSAQKTVSVNLPIAGNLRISSGGIFFTVKRPAGVEFKKGQFLLCRGVYKSNAQDTAQKGTGFISRIYADSIECTMTTKNITTMPVKGDLCSFLVPGQEGRSNDVFYQLARFAINFTSVYEDMLFDAFTSLGDWPEGKSQSILDELVKDIRFTGAEMLKQSNGQQQTIEGGDFDGKLLFTAMQEITVTNVQHFLGYVWARPAKYAGNTWKISEVFATWMVSKTPKRVIDQE